MVFYLALLFFVALTSFIYTYAKDIGVAFCSKSICFLLLFLPAACRYGIGTDYFNYVTIFENIKSGQQILQEPSWYLLNLFVIKLNLDVQWIFVISSFFTVYFITKTPKKDFFIVVVLFFCLYYLDSYNITRQALAMSICWYSYLCFLKDKKKTGYAFAVIAGLVHFSAFLLLIVFFVMQKFHLKDTGFFIFCLFLIFLMYFTHFFEKLLFGIISFTKYSVYIENLAYYNSRAGGFGNIGSILVRFSILLWLFFSVQKRKCIGNEYSYLQILTLALCLFDLLGISIFMFQRVRMLFFITYMALMKQVYHRKNSLAVSQNIIFGLFFICYYLVLKLLTGANAIIPYTHIKLF